MHLSIVSPKTEDNGISAASKGETFSPSQNPLHRFKVGALNIEIHSDHESASKAAANEAVRTLTRLGQAADEFGVIFATGASQISTLQALTSTPRLPWNKVIGFHLDEYVALADRAFGIL